MGGPAAKISAYFKQGGTRQGVPRSFEDMEIFTMASPARIFFAGVGTTFAILAVGFGGGLLMANSSLSGTSAQKQPSSEPPAAARIVHPNSAEPALQVAASVPTEPTQGTPQPPPQLTTDAAADTAVPVSASTPNLSTPAAFPTRIEERSKTRRDLRAERRQRYAERRARRHQSLPVLPDQQAPGIMAFDGSPPPRTGFFGN